MDKIKELFSKLEQQISENDNLMEENNVLKTKISQLEGQQSRDPLVAFGGSNNPLFNLFIDKIASLEN